MRLQQQRRLQLFLLLTVQLLRDPLLLLLLPLLLLPLPLLRLPPLLVARLAA